MFGWGSLRWLDELVAIHLTSILNLPRLLEMGMHIRTKIQIGPFSHEIHPLRHERMHVAVNDLVFRQTREVDSRRSSHADLHTQAGRASAETGDAASIQNIIRQFLAMLDATSYGIRTEGSKGLLNPPGLFIYCRYFLCL